MLFDIAVSLLPCLLFLVVLQFLDSYKLVAPRSVLASIAVGALAAFACLHLNSWLLGRLGASPAVFSRYVAPFTEEGMKAIYVAYLITSKRVGFMVDAAIHGFAVGAGFALSENIYYLGAIEGGTVLLWVVRGFGTAVVHGSVMAIFGILSKSIVDRHAAPAWHHFLPGLAAAVSIHSFFNHFILPPLAFTGVLLAVLPLLVVLVFDRSEKATRAWLGLGFDTDLELLEEILTGEIRRSRVGVYLESLKSRFPGTVVGDMLCLIRVHVELSMRAKGMLLAREAGLRIPIDQQVQASLAELKYLEGAVGKTGRLALKPFLSRRSRDLWQLYMLGK